MEELCENTRHIDLFGLTSDIFLSCIFLHFVWSSWDDLPLLIFELNNGHFSRTMCTESAVQAAQVKKAWRIAAHSCPLWSWQSWSWQCPMDPVSCRWCLHVSVWVRELVPWSWEWRVAHGSHMMEQMLFARKSAKCMFYDVFPSWFCFKLQRTFIGYLHVSACLPVFFVESSVLKSCSQDCQGNPNDVYQIWSGPESRAVLNRCVSVCVHKIGKKLKMAIWIHHQPDQKPWDFQVPQVPDFDKSLCHPDQIRRKSPPTWRTSPEAVWGLNGDAWTMKLHEAWWSRKHLKQKIGQTKLGKSSTWTFIYFVYRYEAVISDI